MTGSVGCTETQYEPGGRIPATEKLQILSHKMGIIEYGTPVVTGTAKNVSSSNISYAEVRVKFYESSGTLLSTSIDNILDLGSVETWSFEVMYLGMNTENVKSYNIGVRTVL